jgi:Holliday junction resolvasome RuvABC DNA-binding subunit
MIFNKPAKLNGATLTDELAAVGIIVDQVMVDGAGNLVLEIADKDKAKADQVIANHKGEDSPDPKAAARASALAKLAALGLSADEIAAL